MSDINAEIRALADTLRDTVDDLNTYIEARAVEIAEPRITAAEHEAAERAAEAEGELAALQQRFNDLRAEFKRQFAAMESSRARLAWLAGYLPEAVRHLGLRSDYYGYPLPDERLITAADQAAEEAGLDADRHPGRAKHGTRRTRDAAS